MQPPHHLVLTLLYSLPLLSAVLSIQCNKTQYAWPGENPWLCCNRCPPGTRMAWRQDRTCEINCVNCMAKQYSDTSNVDLTCMFCRKCDELNMEYESHCTRTHNAVCRCKAGYSCQDKTCSECVPLPTTTTSSTVSPTTTTSSTIIPTKFEPSTPDTSTGPVWFLLTVALLCALVAFVVIAKAYSLQRWIRYKLGYFLAEKPVSVTHCSEEDGVSTPIQEVCGKCDQIMDV